MTSFGPIHTLIVTDVGGPYGPLSTEEFADYEIVHPDECEFEEDEMWGRMWKCGVGWNEREGGVRWSMKYSGCEITEPGEYQIQAWAETIRGFDYTEHDGGIGFAEPPTPPGAALVEDMARRISR